MDTLIRILSFLIIEIILAITLPKITNNVKKDEKLAEQNNKVYFHRTIITLFIVCCSIMTILSMLLLVASDIISEEVGFAFYIISIPLLLVSTIYDYLVIWLNRSVLYFEEFFVYISAFDKKIINYSDIIEIKKTKFNNLIIKTNNEKILLYRVMLGLDKFEIKIKEKLANINF